VKDTLFFSFFSFLIPLWLLLLTAVAIMAFELFFFLALDSVHLETSWDPSSGTALFHLHSTHFNWSSVHPSQSVHRVSSTIIHFALGSQGVIPNPLFAHSYHALLLMPMFVMPIAAGLNFWCG